MKFDYEKLVEYINSRVSLAEHMERVGVVKDAAQSNSKTATFFSPWSNEKTGSLKVNLKTNMFTDFSSGGVGNYGFNNGKQTQWGNIINFVRRHQNLNSFVEVVAYLRDMYDLDLASVGFEINGNGTVTKFTYTPEQQAIINANTVAAEIWEWNLKTKVGKDFPDNAYDYAVNVRHFTEETIKEFKMGYAQYGSNFPMYSWFMKKGVPVEVALDAGLITKAEGGDSLVLKPEEEFRRYNNMFNERLVIPIHDRYGNIIGFGGRTINNNVVKYINSKETPVFSKNETLFNYHRAVSEMIKTGDVFVMEGFLDVVSAWQYGIKNAVASMGTAISLENMTSLAAQVRTQYLCFDSDKAGVKAVSSLMNQILESKDKFLFDVKILIIPNVLAKDPDEYLSKFGKESFLNLKKLAVDFLEFLLISNESVLTNSKDRFALDSFLSTYFKALYKSSLPLTSQYYYLQLVADKTKLPIGVIEKQYAETNQTTSYVTMLAEMDGYKVLSLMKDVEFNEASQTLNDVKVNKPVEKDEKVAAPAPSNEAVDLPNLTEERAEDLAFKHLSKLLISGDMKEIERIILDKIKNPLVSIESIVLKNRVPETRQWKRMYRVSDIREGDLKDRVHVDKENTLIIRHDSINRVFGKRNRGLIEIKSKKSSAELSKVDGLISSEFITDGYSNPLDDLKISEILKVRRNITARSKPYINNLASDYVAYGCELTRTQRRMATAKAKSVPETGLVDDWVQNIVNFAEEIANSDIKLKSYIKPTERQIVVQMITHTIKAASYMDDGSLSKDFVKACFDHFKNGLNSGGKLTNKDVFSVFTDIDIILKEILNNVADGYFRVHNNGIQLIQRKEEEISR